MRSLTGNVTLLKVAQECVKKARSPHPISYALVLMLSLSSSHALADRFKAPSLKQQLNTFDKRMDSSIFNVDYLLAHVTNNTKKTVRKVGEVASRGEGILQNAAVFTNRVTNSTNGVGGTNAGSVVIPPGTNANTIIIINQNQGDSIAIQR